MCLKWSYNDCDFGAQLYECNIFIHPLNRNPGQPQVVNTIF